MVLVYNSGLVQLLMALPHNEHFYFLSAFPFASFLILHSDPDTFFLIFDWQSLF